MLTPDDRVPGATVPLPLPVSSLTLSSMLPRCPSNIQSRMSPGIAHGTLTCDVCTSAPPLDQLGNLGEPGSPALAYQAVFPIWNWDVTAAGFWAHPQPGQSPGRGEEAWKEPRNHTDDPTGREYRALSSF